MQKKWLKHISNLFAILALVLVMVPSVASATSDTPSSGTPDGTPPVLTDFSLEATTMDVYGSIEVTISATDDVSGVSGAQVSFYCKETNRSLWCSLSPTYWDDETGERLPYPDGKLHGFIKADEYMDSGDFLLDYIYVSDKASNTQWYEDKPSGNEKPFPDFVSQRMITLTAASSVDTIAPTLTGITVATTEITAPGSIEVSVSATDNSSGVSGAQISFYCKETNRSLWCSLSPTYWDNATGERLPYPDGKLHGFIEVNQYLLAGDFLLDYIYVSDNAGNTQWYEDVPYGDELPFPDFVTQRKITVLNSVPDVATSVANSDFVKQLEETANDAYIVADYSGDATLPSDAFDAIAGTDKTLDLVSDGVTWRFNGSDIKNESKPIDLNVVIETVEEHPSDDSDDIQEALEDKSAIVMQFPENGQLPGAATIQLKVDHVMREYLGGERNLSVYYFNNETGELELVAKDLTIINDTFVEFTITHCSHYVLVREDIPFPFVDVPNGSWYLNSVKWAVSNKITSGIDATHFGPENPCTRGQIVSFLWRAAGSPEPQTNNNPFSDVKSSDYFYKAVLWAVENNITAGVSKTSFAPNSPCTRGQIVTFLWRYKGEPATSASNAFKDVPSGQYYSSAVAWAVKNNITSGVGNGRFAPNDTCTRAQIVAFLYRTAN